MVYERTDGLNKSLLELLIAAKNVTFSINIYITFVSVNFTGAFCSLKSLFLYPVAKGPNINRKNMHSKQWPITKTV